MSAGVNDGAPLVSVVIPAFNAARYIRQAINSVFVQTYEPIEIVVVDDGAEDETAKVLRDVEERLRYARQSHLGIGAARNHGVRLARGSLLSFLDADDLFTPDKTRLQVDCLLAQPDVDVVFGHFEEFVSEELTDSERLDLAPRRGTQLGPFCQGMLLRRDSFDRVGPFAEGLHAAEFIDWYSRAVEIGLRVAVLPDLVFRRRVHLHNTTRGDRRDFVRVAKAAIDRRRRRPA